MFTPNYRLDMDIFADTTTVKDEPKQNDVFDLLGSPQYLILAITVGCYCFLGTVGNLPVLVVYFRKRDKKAADLFIRVLAVLDLLVSAVIMPYTVIYELHLVRSDIICRGLEFVRHFTMLASNMTLVAIAVERYCAVCNLSQRFNVQNVNQGILVVLTVSLLLAFPSIGIFAVVPASDLQDINCTFPHISNETMFCHFTTSVVGETVAYIYQGVLMMSFFVSFTMIVILYTIVYSVLWKRSKIRNAHIKHLEADMAEKSTVSSDIYDRIISVNSSPIGKHSNNKRRKIPAVINPQLSDLDIANEKYPLPDTKDNFTSDSLEKLDLSENNEEIRSPDNKEKARLTDVNEKNILSDNSDPTRLFDNNERFRLPMKHKQDRFKTEYDRSDSSVTGSDQTAPSTSTCQSSSDTTRISATSISTLMHSRHNNMHHRTAKMLFLCTVIYLMSWMPFWFDIFGVTSNIVFRYTFFFANATNPFVYGIVNGNFRKAFIKVICKPIMMLLCGNKTNNNNDGKQSKDTTINSTSDTH